MYWNGPNTSLHSAHLIYRGVFDLDGVNNVGFVFIPATALTAGATVLAVIRLLIHWPIDEISTYMYFSKLDVGPLKKTFTNQFGISSYNIETISISTECIQVYTWLDSF